VEGEKRNNIEKIEALSNTLPIEFSMQNDSNMASVEAIQTTRYLSMGINNVTVTGNSWSKFDRAVLACLIKGNSDSQDREVCVFKGTLGSISRALQAAKMKAKDKNILESLTRLSSLAVTVSNRFGDSSGNIVRQIAVEGKTLRISIDRLYADYFSLTED
jgi:hypothetical protein